MQYTTQMDAARKGIITKEMESAAKKEQMDVRELMTLMAKGQVIIPCNKNTPLWSQTPLVPCSERRSM